MLLVLLSYLHLIHGHTFIIRFQRNLIVCILILEFYTFMMLKKKTLVYPFS